MNWTYFSPCLWAFLACLGFCVMLNVRRGAMICSAGGALGWLVYLLVSLAGGNDLICYFLAAMAIAAFSEIMARVRKYPVTSYLIISILPLVPGAGIYNTMQFALQGDTQQLLTHGLHTLGVAGCLAVGVLVVSSSVRMFLTFKIRRRKA